MPVIYPGFLQISKKKFNATLVYGQKPLTIVARSSTLDVTRVLDNHAIGRFFVIHGKSVCDETIKIGFIVKILKKKLLNLSSFLKNHMQSLYNFHNIFYNNILVSQKKKKKKTITTTTTKQAIYLDQLSCRSKCF